jgi:hypothetical protein
MKVVGIISRSNFSALGTSSGTRSSGKSRANVP